MDLLNQCPVCDQSIFEHYITCSDHMLTGEKFDIVKCVNCGFKFTNPRPEIIKLGSYYKSPEYISHTNSNKGIFNRIYQSVRKFTLSKKYSLISEFSAGSRILDIGCATGEFLNFMKEKKWSPVGIEPDDTARSRGVEKYNLEVYNEEHLNKLPTGSFDVITMWHVLEHVPYLQERVRTISRLLKQDGIVLIAVPNCNSFDARYYNEYWAAYDVPRHLYHFSQKSMKMLLEKNNFKLVSVQPMKFDSFYVSLLSEKYRSGKMRWGRGLILGLWSNLKAIKQNEYSSVIFVAKNR